MVSTDTDTDTDTDGWTGTDVRFEIRPIDSATDAGTTLRSTHDGLDPAFERYDACSIAWSSYLDGSLARLAGTGVADPNQERRDGALEGLANAAERSV